MDSFSTPVGDRRGEKKIMSEDVTLQGVVHDQRIEIPAPPGFVDGQLVTVTLKVVGPSDVSPARDGIVRAFGILSAEEGASLEQFLAEERPWRQLERRDQQP
jgi:hypothetical protein